MPESADDPGSVLLPSSSPDQGEPARRHPVRTFRNYLIGGLLIWIPIMVTVWVVRFVARILDQSLVLLPHAWRPQTLVGSYVPGVGVILSVARERIGQLVIRLGDILRADQARSAAALETTAQQAGFGEAHRGLFDFQAMSRLLSRGVTHGGLGERRRRRIEATRSVLERQRFFPAPGQADGGDAYGFEFVAADAALVAFRERLPELARLLKALQVAELEVEGSYVEGMHDAIFDAFDERSVTAQDMEFFPDYLVCVGGQDEGTHGRLAEALSSGVPLKVLVQVTDLLEEAVLGQGHFAFGLRAVP